MGIPRGSINIGDIADITVIDPEFSWIYDVNSTKSKSKNSPFHNRNLKGKAVYTIVNGQVISKN